MIFEPNDKDQRLKWVFSSCKNGAWGTEPDGETDVVCIRATDFDGRLGRLNNDSRTLRSIDSETYKKLALRSGDIILEKSGGGEKQLVGRTALFDGAKPSITSNFLARCRPISSMEPAYINYLLLAIYNVHGTFPHIKQSIGIQNLDLVSFLNVRINIPPIDTQRRIAQFLDEKTARIDVLIEKKQELLEQLAEKRQAFITQAVTKGLKPEASMKPSNIEWLDEIPAHWELRRLKFGTTKIGSGITPRGGASVYVNSGVILLRSQNVHFENLALGDVVFIDDDIDKEMSETRVFFGDVLLNITGASIGRCCVFDQANTRANVNQHVCIIRPANFVADFVAMFLASSVGQLQIDISQNGASREGLNFGDLGNFIVPTPPFAEQADIAKTMRLQVDAIGEQSLRVSQSISILEEYRNAVIMAAVTGQIAEVA